MTPLQRIAMGLVIVIVPASFPQHPHPVWRSYDALPDPVGWVLVLTGVWALGRALDVDVARWLAVVALAVSIPLWLPQLNHLLVPAYNPGIGISLQWFIALPQTLFALVLARTVEQGALAQEPRDLFVAGRFRLLTWALGAVVVLPVIAYGGGVRTLQTPTLVLVGLVNVVVVYYLFRVHRRTWLGGPGPLLVTPRRREPDPS